MIFTKKCGVVSAKHIDVYDLIFPFHVQGAITHFFFDMGPILFKNLFPKIFKVISLFHPVLSGRVITSLQDDAYS